jgi:hypothetical protein
MANVPYANEKLSKAMRLLITGIGPIRQRLEAAFLAASTLQPGDFPDNQTRDLWLEIRGVLTSVPGPGGSLRETLAQMSNEQASKIADKFDDLYDLICPRGYWTKEKAPPERG